jgi:hypothetical protein
LMRSIQAPMAGWSWRCRSRIRPADSRNIRPTECHGDGRPRAEEIGGLRPLVDDAEVAADPSQQEGFAAGIGRRREFLRNRWGPRKPLTFWLSKMIQRRHSGRSSSLGAKLAGALGEIGQAPPTG